MRNFSFEKIYPKAIIVITLLAMGYVVFNQIFPPLDDAIIIDPVSSAVTEEAGISQDGTVITQISESVSSGGARSPSDPEALNNSGDFGLININTADISELITLDGIGETRAKAIIEYRETNGGFKSVDELTMVSGIGEKTLEKNRSRIEV